MEHGVAAETWLGGLDGHTIVLALVLVVTAVACKVASGLGVRGKSAGRLTIGLGMMPRGEVGLIFRRRRGAHRTQRRPAVLAWDLRGPGRGGVRDDADRASGAGRTHPLPSRPAIRCHPNSGRKRNRSRGVRVEYAGRRVRQGGWE